jgi:hypothetical protein
MDVRCNTHPGTPALAPCSRCGRSFCDPCLPALVEGLCACAGCADAERAQAGRPWGFAAVVLVCCATASFAFARAEAQKLGQPTWELYGLAFLLAFAFSGFTVSRKRVGLRVEPRQPGDLPEDGRAAAGGPYRALARRVVTRRLPPVSGRLTAFALLMSFGLCALAVPFAMHLPRWVEAEIVFAAGWAIWTALLAAILYRGDNVADDHRFAPSLWMTKKGTPGAPGAPRALPSRPSGVSWFEGIDIAGSDGEGCVLAIGAVILAGAAILTAWLLVELVIPALFSLAYLLLIRALKVATSDATGCAGDLSRSIRRGSLYASVFMGPLFVLAWIVHVVAGRT